MTNKRNIFWFLLFCMMAALSANASPIRYKQLSLYDSPLYQSGFTNFKYVNPHAPKGGKITLPAYGGFDNFNPFILKGIAAPEVAELTLESLGVIPVDDPATVYPLIAKEFEVGSNFVGFIVDEKASFSNGDPILADDVIFSYQSLIKKGSPFYRVYYSDVDRVEKVNDRHVRFYFKSGTSNKELPLILSQFKIYSKQDWEGKDFAKPTLQKPLGSGPYILEKFSPNKYMVFKRNPTYWAKNIPSRKGFFNFDEIRFDYYQDTTVTLQALFAGSIDLREEYIAKIWASGYNNDLVKSGKVIKEEIPHNQPATLQYFGFNTRLDKFSDPKVREAIGLAFNFDWANKNLFYDQYRRIDSYFANTTMAAKGLPQGKELDLLQDVKDNVPSKVFSTPYVLPTHNDHIQTRKNLRRAVELLRYAGYDFVDGKMTHIASNKPLEIEVLGNAANGSSFTRVMLPFIENLKKIGIKTTFRNLEVNVFKNRLDNFDFEVAILSIRMSNLPGNELKEVFGSGSADIKGSYNYMGIKNQAVDKLIDTIISAQQKEEYIAAIKALDRVLLHEHYLIPQWYSPHNRIAYHKGLKHLQTDFPAGFNIYTWWREQQQ
ncbi:MAG: ABC transporter substrate-binding protein [Alphaproteobacteria bacterium]|nr:ABC transporter substrate-binding protein [Alphaproteobacteria bacterium]